MLAAPGTRISAAEELGCQDEAIRSLASEVRLLHKTVAGQQETIDELVSARERRESQPSEGDAAQLALEQCQAAVAENKQLCGATEHRVLLLEKLQTFDKANKATVDTALVTL